MDYRKPKRIFEDSGTVDPVMSYHVELKNVVNTRKQDIKTIVDMGRYFSIFAPRQSGKTTYFEDFCRALEKDPVYVAIMLSFQKYRTLHKHRFYQLIQKDLYSQLTDRLEAVNCPKLNVIRAYLTQINRNSLKVLDKYLHENISCQKRAENIF